LSFFSCTGVRAGYSETCMTHHYSGIHLLKN
jgi:hypothetical protein